MGGHGWRRSCAGKLCIDTLCGQSQPQHDSRAWIGGHLTDPNEQKTQQSPAFGRSKVLQASHS